MSTQYRLAPTDRPKSSQLPAELEEHVTRDALHELDRASDKGAAGAAATRLASVL